MSKQIIYWWRPPIIPAHLFKAAANDCQQICSQLHTKGLFLLSGISADTPLFDAGKIEFKGVPGFEVFLLPRISSGIDRGGQVFEYCKTNGLPYEAAVLACLSIFKLHLEHQFHISIEHRIYQGLAVAQEIESTFNRMAPAL